MKKQGAKVVLLRVGIDTGCGGILGPIFADGSFEFVPIGADEDLSLRTYANTPGRHERMLIEYFPNQLKKRKIKEEDLFMHFDPEFDTFTYGDPTTLKQSLKELQRGDLLVLYAGLKGWGECEIPPGLYIIGYFVVEHAGKYKDLKSKGVIESFSKNSHIINNDIHGRKVGKKRKRRVPLVLIKGGKGSLLLEKAVKISAIRKDRGGHPVYVLDGKMEKHFGKFTPLNAIQRSTPRFVKPEFRAKAAKFVRSLR